jgi:hypothetical protein
MSDEKMLPFERQFDEKPTRIGIFEMLTDEVMGVYIHQGRVECPIYPPDDAVDEDHAVYPFLLQMTPREARDLAGLLIYAAGRAEEHAEHCVGCGEPLNDDDDDEDEDG